MNNRGQQNMIHIIVGILLIMGGALYLIDQGGLGAVVAATGFLIEVVFNFFKNII